MTSLEAIEKFDILTDKYGSPYFTQAEKLNFLNMAQLEVLNRMVPDTIGGVGNYELDQNTLHNISPLIFTFETANYVYATGIKMSLEISTINTTIQSSSGDASAKLFRVLSIVLDDRQTPVRFIKYNNRGAYTDNTFKSPVTGTPVFTLDSTTITIYPPVNDGVWLTVLKTPIVMTAGNSPDWSDYVMNQVISVAVQYATIGFRDVEAAQLIQNTNISK